jgi:AGCS family alanine or glycine:cation symporter
MRVLNDFRGQLKAGNENPVFDPARFSDLDIDASAWKLDEVISGRPVTQPAE